MLAHLLPFFLLAVSSAYSAIPSATVWPKPFVREPRGFVANALGQGCLVQVVFEREVQTMADEGWTYGVIGNFDSLDVNFPQLSIPPRAPLTAVNASVAQHLGAFRLQDGSGLGLLPIQIWGCVDAVRAKTLQVYAVAPNRPGWFSPKFNITSFTPPDQVMQLTATRGAFNTGKVNVSWSVTANQYSLVRGAFVLTRPSQLLDGPIETVFVETGKTFAVLDVGVAPVDVAVARYDNGGNGALSDVMRCPQVQI